LINYGITDEAIKYIYKHSNFMPYDDVNTQPIGCKYSDGYANINAELYDKKEVNGIILLLFKYYLKDDVVVKEVVQEIKNEKVFLCLEINGIKKFKWKKDE